MRQEIRKEKKKDKPLRSRYVDALGSRMHYLEAGAGTVFLLLHGNPTSSYIWRHVIPGLAGYGRCIAPDLIGMGQSGKPDIPYHYTDHCRYLEAFLESLGIERFVLVGHDWGSALGLRYWDEHPETVQGLAVMEAILHPFLSKDLPVAQRALIGLLRHPFWGRRLLIDMNFYVEGILPAMTKRRLSPSEMKEYRNPFRRRDSREPVLRWVWSLPIDGEPSDVHERVLHYWERLQKADVPKLLLWSDPGLLIKPPEAERLGMLLPGLETLCIGSGKHYVQEDQPGAIASAVGNWYRRKVLPRLVRQS